MKTYTQSLKIFKSKSIFFRILFFMVITIFLSIILVGYISYYYSSSLLIKEAKESNLLLIKQVGNDIDKEISNIERLTFQLSLQPEVKASLYSSEYDYSNNQILYMNIIKAISNAKMSNQNVSEIWVDIFRTDTVLNNEGKYSNSFFFRNVFNYRNGFNLTGVIQKHPSFISLGSQDIFTDSKEKTVITFARGISVDDAIPNGIICANVDEAVIKNTLNSSSLKNNINTFIIDTNGVKVTESSSEIDDIMNNDELENITKLLKDQDGYLIKKIGGRGYVISYSSSKLCNWNYVSVIPTDIITEKADNIKHITLVAAFICLIIGICISFLLTRRIYEPINEIISYINAFQIQRKVNNGEIKENELLFINRIINYVYNENKNLIDTFNQNIPVLEEKLLYDLLEGKYTKEAFEKDTNRLNMAFPYSNYQVIVFEMENYSVYSKAFSKELSSNKKIEEITRENYKDMNSYTLRRGNDKIITLVNSSSEIINSETIYDFVEKVKVLYKENYNISMTVGIGNAYNSPEKVYMSLIDAMSALKYKIVKGQGSIIHIDEISSIPENIFEYSIETENQLINLIKIGDTDGMEALIDEVINVNLNLKKTSPEAIENLFNTLAGTAIRTIYDVRSTVTEIFGSNKNLYKELLELNNIKDKKEYVLKELITISEYISGRKAGQSQKILLKINEYIQNNYTNDLSLTQISKYVGLSPTYLSSIFKEMAGESFVDYVNRIRINKSKELLTSSDFTVAQIADKVGFISSNTFIKVFKKHEGITPGQFRDTMSNR